MVQLLTLSKRILHEVESLEVDATKSVKNYGSEMVVFFQFFYSQFSSMRSILSLLNESQYKDCFIILRSLLESYLFLLQMMKGNVYKISKDYTIIPNSGHTKKDARDKTLEKWREEQKDREDIIKVKPKGKDQITVNYQLQGFYEKKISDTKDI